MDIHKDCTHACQMAVDYGFDPSEQHCVKECMYLKFNGDPPCLVCGQPQPCHCNEPEGLL